MTHYCQDCGIQLKEEECYKWAWCNFYECFCNDHAWKAKNDRKIFYCKMCSKMIAVSISNVSFGSDNCYCDKCKQESISYMNTYLYGDNQSKERIAGIIFKYDYLTGKEVIP